MTPWKPWHQVVQLRDDLKSGELSLAMFAADLYDVMMGQAKPIYQKPDEFFALTYPTFALRELAKDVVLRLAGQSEKAIRQLELTYGGGKTHTLITLYHLVNNPDNLPELPAVDEFITHIGLAPPKTRVAALTFDKLDAEKGMEVQSPDGEKRWLKQPWSVLAFQLAGIEGLKLISADNTDTERESAPAENLWSNLLKIPASEGLGTLILIDEVLMYVREKVALDEKWRTRLVNFFQYLLQAVTKSDRACIVASLLASDPNKNDTFGRELTLEIANIFQRQEEEKIQPVGKDDVAEVLRRRLFKPDSIQDRTAFKPQVVAALKGIAALDEQTNKARNLAEQQFVSSYPFHPHLTEIFYSKWTGLEKFQRTRGVLRTFTLALRDAEKWDTSPLIGANVFIGDPTQASLSDGAQELTNIATTEEYEGKRQDWNNIIEGELAKARELQAETNLKHREIEQAVFATFLHSQPIGQKALTRELLLLLGHTNPDKIELGKALIRWVNVSWFLDEEMLQDIESGQNQLPKFWRLGSKANLKQMHHEACKHRVSNAFVERSLEDEIKKCKNLIAGAKGTGIQTHLLPKSPSDIKDDGQFHYAVLDPQATCTSGNPSAYAAKFITETGSNAPRAKNRNVIVLAVPDRSGLDVARSCIRNYLGWMEVQDQLKNQDMDTNRKQLLESNLKDSKNKIPGAVEQAYCIVVTVSDKDEIQAFKVQVGNGEPLFNVIKADSKSRIQETAITAEAILPGSAYDLWREGEPSRRFNDLVGAFSQRPALPKMLKTESIRDTLIDGCVEGIFVLRYMRGDRSFKTFWRTRPDEVALKEPSLEAVLPEFAELSELDASVLEPNRLQHLWTGNILTLGDVYQYFSGSHTIEIPKEGYSEYVAIPKTEQSIIDAAIAEAVKSGKLCLIAENTCLLEEDIPTGLLTETAQLQPPPQPISINDILPENLPAAWQDGQTNAGAIAQFLSQAKGHPLPWKIVANAIEGILRTGRIAYAPNSAHLPCPYADAATVLLQLPQPAVSPSSEPIPDIASTSITSLTVPTNPAPSAYKVATTASTYTPKNSVKALAQLSISEIQELSDKLNKIKQAAVGMNLKFEFHIELSGDLPPSDEVIGQINEILHDISDKLTLQ